MTHTTTVPITQLPDLIRSFLEAHAARDVDRALLAFAPTAEVMDEGRTFRGTDEVRSFLRTAGSQFTYTTQLLGAERLTVDVWVAHNRIEGDFPGGVADLAFRFELVDGLIARLTIG